MGICFGFPCLGKLPHIAIWGRGRVDGLFFARYGPSATFRTLNAVKPYTAKPFNPKLFNPYPKP